MSTSEEYPLTEAEALKAAIDGEKVRAREHDDGCYVSFDSAVCRFLFHHPQVPGVTPSMRAHYPNWQIIRELDDSDPESYRDLTTGEMELLVGQAVVCCNEGAVRLVVGCGKNSIGVAAVRISDAVGAHMAESLRLLYVYRDTGKPVGVLKK